VEDAYPVHLYRDRFAFEELALISAKIILEGLLTGSSGVLLFSSD